jgi:uncharacterized membrane protein
MVDNPSSGIFQVRQGPTFFSHVKRTIQYVSLLDPQLVVLYLFLLMWFILLVRTRRRLVTSFVLFTVTCVLIGLTPSINAFMNQNWSSFRFRSNYFDMTCLFVLVFWCLPLLVQAGVVLAILLIDLVRDNWDGLIRHIFTHVRWFRRTQPRPKQD